MLLLRHGVKQQLTQLENRLSDSEVAQLRWWTWASQYRRRKVPSCTSAVCCHIGITYASQQAAALQANENKQANKQLVAFLLAQPVLAL